MKIKYLIIFLFIIDVSAISAQSYYDNFYNNKHFQKLLEDSNKLFQNFEDEFKFYSFKYRGIDIDCFEGPYLTSYSVTELGLFSPSLAEIKTEINRYIFREMTEIYSPRLENLFILFDRNKDAEITWSELETFLDTISENEKYKNNNSALPPNAFIKQGGGDCEDWAIFISSFLFFWNIECYIGILELSNNTYHAVTLLYSKRKIEKFFSFYYKTDFYSSDNRLLKAGYYIPIDYNYIGKFSNAVTSNFKLVSIYYPISLYNWDM